MEDVCDCGMPREAGSSPTLHTPVAPEVPPSSLSWGQRTERELQQKCDHSYGEPGFLSRYSFGLRYEIFKQHRHAKGFKLLASDYPPSMPPPAERTCHT